MTDNMSFLMISPSYVYTIRYIIMNSSIILIYNESNITSVATAGKYTNATVTSNAFLFLLSRNILE